MSSLQKPNVLAEIYRICDPILGDSITVEEVEGAIQYLKPMCSDSADSSNPELTFKNGLCQLFNYLLKIEQIPSVFKHRVSPCIHGKG